MKRVVKNSKHTVAKKRLKKYEEGGKEVQGVKRNNTWDSFPGSNMPAAPKTEVTEMNLKSEPTAKENVIQKTDTLSNKSEAPKAKLLPGGFTSEAQKAAYIKNAKNRILKGETVKDLVSSKFGTAVGLKSLGIVDKPLQTKKITPNKVQDVKPKTQPIKQKVKVAKPPIKQKVEVAKPPIKQKVEVAKPPIKQKRVVETEGQRLARVGKKQANSYKGSPERISKETKVGRMDTVVNTKQNGNKQTKVSTYNKKGEKLKTYYKEAGSRSSLDTSGRKYLNSKGTIYTEIDRIGNKKVTKGKNISMDPTKKGAFKRGSIIEKISYKNPSGFISNLDFSKKPVKLKKGGKINK